MFFFQCLPTYFIEYFSSLWFVRSSTTSLLNSKVLSVGVKDKESQLISSPVRFRVHTHDKRVAAKQAR